MKRNEKKKLSFWQQPRFRYGAFSTVLMALLVAAVIALNFAADAIEKKNGWRVDFSFNALTTQSETTLEVLGEMKHPVHVYALFPRGQEDLPLMELLDRYAAASPLFTWERTDASLNPALLTRFSSTDSVVENDSLIVYCEETDRWRILSPKDFISVSLNYEEGAYEIAGLTYESQITSAIAYVEKESIAKVHLITGHNELDESSAAALIDLLQSNHYAVDFIDLKNADNLPPEDLVVLLSPVRDLMDAELARLTEFTSHGGSLLITCDYTDPVGDNYAALLRAYGVTPKNGIVVASPEEPGTYYNNIRIDLLPKVASTDMTYDLVNGGSCVLLLTGSRAFDVNTESDRHLDAQAVLNSGDRAYLKDVTGVLSLEQKDTDETGPFALAVRSRRMTTDGYLSRCLVLGCSTLLTSQQIYAMTDAQDFILTAVNWLMGGESMNLGIAAKAAIRPQLSAASVNAGAVVIVAVPLVVIAVAVVVLWKRRRG